MEHSKLDAGLEYMLYDGQKVKMFKILAKNGKIEEFDNFF